MDVRPGSPHDRSTPVTPERYALPPLVVFGAIAVAAGWATLTPPVLLGLPQEPFVLLALCLGLVMPALMLTAREDGGTGVRRLLRGAVRPPRPLLWAPLALLVLPVLVWSTAAIAGGAQRLDAPLLAEFAVALLASALIVNIWEEMAWTGFFQRRAMANWGLTQGSLVTALLFAGMHVPLAFEGADGALDVLAGMGVLLATGVGLRFLIAGLDSWSGHSLLAAGLLHASFNASPTLIDPAHDWTRYAVTVALGMAALLAVRRSAGDRGSGVASARTAAAPESA